MEYQMTEKQLKIFLDDEFNLKNTFECGQCFRWNENPDGSYSGIVQNQEITIKKDENIIIIQNENTNINFHFWKEYFDLENNYGNIKEQLKKSCPKITCALESINGIRILRQDTWEALCSFIISQNNHIPRIKGIILRLCENFGEKLETGYTFPSADKIAKLNEKDLEPLRAGFRTKYILDAARKVSSGEVNLSALKTAPLQQCREELCKITGVGAKVAECTLLYGLHRMEAFPIDTWMKQALQTLFNGIKAEELGEYAGIAQQYIFHYSRTNPELVKNKK